MRRMIFISLTLFVLAVGVPCVSWAELDSCGSSLSSNDSEVGQEEMQDMDNSMEVQPGDVPGTMESDGVMDVQSGDSIDSEGTGAH